MSTEVSDAGRVEDPRLRRDLHLWEAVGLSLALMAPSMAANINPQGTAGSVGRAVPLAFALATVGVLLIAWTFVRLTQRFNHAGSVYGFVGASLGPRTGVVAGWALMGTYTFYGVVTVMATGIFGAEFLNSLGIWTNQPEWAPFVVGAVALAGVWGFAASRIREGTRVLLLIEGTTVALILIVSVVHTGQARDGHGPQRQHSRLLGVHGAGRDGHVGALSRDRLRVPLVRRVRGGGNDGRGGRTAPARYPARDTGRRHLRRPLLRLRYLRRGYGLRDRRQGRGELCSVGLAAG